MTLSNIKDAHEIITRLSKFERIAVFEECEIENLNIKNKEMEI